MENIGHADFPHRSQNSSLDCKTPGATDLSKPHVEAKTLVCHSERLDSAVLDSSSYICMLLQSFYMEKEANVFREGWQCDYVIVLYAIL